MAWRVFANCRGLTDVMYSRIRAILLVLALVPISLSLALAGCYPHSNVARCDRLLDPQLTQIIRAGGWLRCDPSYDPDEPSNATHVMQWNKTAPQSHERQPWWWLWDQRLSDRDLVIYGWVGVCEIDAYKNGQIPEFYLNVQKWGVPNEIEQWCVNWAVGQ